MLSNKNKKGNAVGIIIFVILLFVIVIAGFLMSTGGALISWTLDNTVPELTNLGVIGDSNMTEVAEVTLVPFTNFLGNINWFIGVIYVLMLIGSLGFAFYSRMSPEKWLVGLYFLLVLLMVVGSILISNIYEDFYNGTDEYAGYLQDQTVMSFMIINSPVILTIIGFITMAIMFSGYNSEESA